MSSFRLCVIPARGGSKRIPGKNSKHFCGKPVIAYSIEAAQKSECFDRIIVSTDSEKIGALAREYGADVPFMRPAHIADDFTPTRPVIQHAIKEIEASGVAVSHVCCVYPTAPFIRAEDIRRGFEELLARKGDFAFSVTSFPYPVQRALSITPDTFTTMLWPEHAQSRSQDLTEAYHDAGQFYWGTVSAFLSDTPTFEGRSIPIILPRHRVQDLDTPEDWKRATVMYRTLMKEETE
ncbi:pseudaminic acid cytidylyltransferase [Chitinivibrio alkaliphilus]|uniref:Acylneuraminate cytidylyltransferase n=1 Tax=Chitinivibrio alkaliphilus ACht1 TaxID=1313304 RepID=U7DB98_9BACT|nr:pseudaminic acid cytidylyltransferase [Chitinivibrio alkaliphilus]ERP39282.1 acylneuraminate cytidylyltransferase [Chitinivibrio alkaliphilus ACht1]